MNVLNPSNTQLNIFTFYLWRPSRIFWYFVFFTFIIWTILGPLGWRHVDDFGPLESYLTNDKSFQSWKFFFKYQLTIGWGTYPPLWTIWQLISYPFLHIGVNQTRYIILFQGLLSTLLSAYLTTCLSLNFITYLKYLNNSNIRKIKVIIEIFSIAFNCLNPEIMIHSSTYMPYNLSTITTLSLLLILVPINNEKRLFENNFDLLLTNLNYRIFALFTYTTLFFGFQSPILISGFIATILLKLVFRKNQFIILNQYLSKSDFKVFIKDIFSMRNKLLLPVFMILLFITFSYVYKIFLLYGADIKPGNTMDGNWAFGIGNIYNISFKDNNIQSWIIKLINNTISIIGQSLYPYRNFQDASSIFISFILLISFIFVSKIKKIGYIFFINSSIIFFITIILTSYDKFIYSPTRHTIFLYPYFWITLIVFLSNLFLFVNFRFNFFLILTRSLTLILFVFFSVGLANSHNLVQYTSQNSAKLIEMAEESDYLINVGYSFFPSHGSKEFNSSNLKKCTLKSDNEYIKFFIYSHRLISKNDDNLKNILFSFSNGCYTENDDFRIIEKLEKNRKYDIEQNNRIFNGGSSIYAYLIEVKKNY